MRLSFFCPGPKPERVVYKQLSYRKKKKKKRYEAEGGGAGGVTGKEV